MAADIEEMEEMEIETVVITSQKLEINCLFPRFSSRHKNKFFMKMIQEGSNPRPCHLKISPKSDTHYHCATGPLDVIIIYRVIYIQIKSYKYMRL